MANKIDTMGNPSMFGTHEGKINVGGGKAGNVGKSISKRANLGKGGKSTAIGKSKGMSQSANMGKRGY